MKINKLAAAAFMISLVFFGLEAAALRGQEGASKDKVLGIWDVEVTADDQSYFLTMVLNEKDGQLAGTISEQNGVFSDVALSSLNYDGKTLTFEFTCPTPPDGMQRLLQVTFAWDNAALDGSITIPDLGMMVPAKAAKKS